MEITYNPNIEIFERELKRKNISCLDVGLPPRISDKNSVAFADHNEFIAFLKSENIKSVFIASMAIEIEDYYITDDMLCSAIGGDEADRCPKPIAKAILDYNLSIKRYEEQFSELKENLYFTLFNGFMVYIILADKIDLADPCEQLDYILTSKQGEIEAEREQQALLLEEQKEKLKQKILADTAFYQCTNQKLRRAYIDGLIPRLNNEYSLIKKKWTYGTGFVTVDARNFVDMIWYEYKENNKK